MRMGAGSLQARYSACAASVCAFHGTGGRAHCVERRSKRLRRGVDGLCGAIQLAQFIRIGMHMHQGCAGVGC